MTNIKQFKLTSGEEILCEVVEWADEDNCDMVVKKVLRINCVDDDKKGVRYYNLRPWLTMQEGDDVFMTLNANHVIAEANPDGKMLKFFFEAIDQSELSEEDINEKIEDYVTKLKEKIGLVGDSDEGNVIPINFNKNKMH
tara:strand:- start:654 stop:1073 length:420 start_codon:yes stop_codon:yes gene_type:complete